jgi:tetratricopeptide (TPR) repeat protein
LPFFVAVSRLFLGIGYYGLGELDAARKHFEKGYAGQREISVSFAISLYPAYLSRVHLDLADMAKAQRYAEEALELSIKANSLSGEGFSRICLGRIFGISKSSKTDIAESYILQGIEILEELKLRPNISNGYLFLGELYADSGEHNKALKWLKEAEAEFQDMGMNYDLSFTKSLIGKTISRTAPSQFNQCEQTIFDAIKIAQKIESKPALAHGYLCLGEIYADHGQKEKALENLKKAESMYQEMKMGLWLLKTREVLERL